MSSVRWWSLRCERGNCLLLWLDIEFRGLRGESFGFEDSWTVFTHLYHLPVLVHDELSFEQAW